MSTSTSDFELENVAAGPDPFRLSAAADDNDAIVLLFQRDYHCTKRRQVQAIAERYDEFEAADALVAAILPEPADRTANWQNSYDLPYPLLADPVKNVGDEYDRPTRFGIVGSLHDVVVGCRRRSSSTPDRGAGDRDRRRRVDTGRPARP